MTKKKSEVDEVVEAVEPEPVAPAPEKAPERKKRWVPGHYEYEDGGEPS